MIVFPFLVTSTAPENLSSFTSSSMRAFAVSSASVSLKRPVANSAGVAIASKCHSVIECGSFSSTTIANRANWSELRSCTNPLIRVALDSSIFRKSNPPVMRRNAMSPSTFGPGGSLKSFRTSSTRARSPLLKARSQVENCSPAGVFGTSGTTPCDSTTKIVAPGTTRAPDATCTASCCCLRCASRKSRGVAPAYTRYS